MAKSLLEWLQTDDGTESDNIPAQKPYAKTGSSLEAVAWYTYQLKDKKKE